MTGLSVMSHQDRPALPDWFPTWARDLAELYFSGTTCLFLLHGNVHDLFRCPATAGETYCSLSEFLATQVFGSWDVVVHYDMGRGVRPLPGENPKRLQSMMQYLAARWSDPTAWPRDPDQVLYNIDRLVERNLLEERAENRKSIAVLLDYAQYLVPAGDLASLDKQESSRLVRFLGWAQNPYIKRVNTAICLVAEKLTELNDRLVQNPHVGAIEIPLPDAKSREEFATWTTNGKAGGDPAKPLDARQLAEVTSGLNLVNLRVLLSQERGPGDAVDPGRFRRLKKSMIERSCQGLVEFVEPAFKLDMVVGHHAAIEQLKSDAAWIARGVYDAAPMGYLICGPVGTGKTFMAECYAGDIGIPCLKLKNFRSKYVGETEGNLENVLNVLRSLGPVVVIIDEADAALGNRQAEGDSGTSSRVFSMIASQMGDTRYRGKIIWMLLTCRPDLLPIDLKRQGRAEVHIPLFYPDSVDEMSAMFRSMAKKSKVELPEGALPPLEPGRDWSGADIESIVLSARRLAMAAGRPALERDDLERGIAEFIPSAQGLEKELQEIAAVLECTQRKFLPAEWQEKVAQPHGRSKLQERLVAIRQIVEE